MPAAITYPRPGRASGDDTLTRLASAARDPASGLHALTPGMPQQPSNSQRSTSRIYSLLGAILGIGAPLGFLALRMLLARRPPRRSLRDELHDERSAYPYMAIATPLVFGAFGGALGRRQDKLRRAHEQINKMREELSSVVAHDLRTPLAAMIMQLDLLRSTAKDGSVSVPVATVDRLLHSGQRLNRMVVDLLDATRIDAAKLRLEPVLTALPDAMTTLAERLRLTIGNHPLEIGVEGSPPAVMADPTRLEQIVTNLVDNAAKHSPEGAPIRLEICAERGGVVLRVCDRGYGIARDELPHLFERYFQSKDSRTKKTGLGLGLYITKGLVDAHGGSIAVASELNRGSTFAVWLPAAA